MITSETERKIADRIKEEFGDDVEEITEAYPASLLFHAHSKYGTYFGKLTHNGNLSSYPIYKEGV